MQGRYTHGGKPARRNLTVAGLRTFKTKRIFVQVAAYTEAVGLEPEAIRRESVNDDREPGYGAGGTIPVSLVAGAVRRGIGGGMAAPLSGGATLCRTTPHRRLQPAPGPDMDPGQRLP